MAKCVKPQHFFAMTEILLVDGRIEYVTKCIHCHQEQKFHLKGFDSPTEELVNTLAYWVKQYGCTCGHPSCDKCKKSKEAEELLEKHGKF